MKAKATALAEIAIAGLEATDHYLALPETLTEAQDAALMQSLRTVGRGATWWIGDYALSRQQRKGEHYAIPLAECWGISAAHIHKAAMVSRFFNPLHRCKTLTWAHHYEAIRAAGGIGGDQKKARAWLEKAAAENWTAPDLRENITLSLAPAGRLEATAPHETDPYAPLAAADKWATKHLEEVASLDRDRAQELLISLQSVATLIDQLRAIVGVAGASAVSHPARTKAV